MQNPVGKNRVERGRPKRKLQNVGLHKMRPRDLREPLVGDVDGFGNIGPNPFGVPIPAPGLIDPERRTESAAAALIVNGFIEPIMKELPMEYAVELNRLIELEMEGSVG